MATKTAFDPVTELERGPTVIVCVDHVDDFGSLAMLHGFITGRDHDNPDSYRLVQSGNATLVEADSVIGFPVEHNGTQVVLVRD